MKQTQRMGNEWFTGMTIIGSKKEGMAKMVSNINKMDINEIITIPETKEEIKALNPGLAQWPTELITEKVYSQITATVQKINEINLEFQNLSRDAEDMRPDTMPEIIWAIDALRCQPVNIWMNEVFPFINTSEKAGDFLAYVWQFFQNIREILENIYDNRSLKVTDYKKTGFTARHNWQNFTDTRKTTEEILATVNDTATKLWELRQETEELKLYELKQKTEEKRK